LNIGQAALSDFYGWLTIDDMLREGKENLVGEAATSIPVRLGPVPDNTPLPLYLNRCFPRGNY
jgi:hypothetical protein